MRAITNLDELRSIELSVLKRIDAWCKEHGITYFLAYGTLLGVVRHKGLIPWDDDIDLWMLKPDHDRFIAEFQEGCPNVGLRIGAAETNPGYNRTFVKVYDSTVKGSVEKVGVWCDPASGRPSP